MSTGYRVRITSLQYPVFSTQSSVPSLQSPVPKKMLPTNATFLKSSTLIEQCPAPDKPEFAFIGRSNVGKSSLINMLVNKKNMAKTSGTPGKTRLINHFEITSNSGSWYLVDLPGYGYAKISSKSTKYHEPLLLVISKWLMSLVFPGVPEKRGSSTTSK